MVARRAARRPPSSYRVFRQRAGGTGNERLSSEKTRLARLRCRPESRKFHAKHWAVWPGTRLPTEEAMASRYHDVYGAWRANPEAFWAEAAREIDWIKAAAKIFDANAGVYGRWFPDATCNTCYNALDRHADGGRGAQAALIYDSPVTGAKRTYTYARLRDDVAALAAVLQDLGVAQGRPRHRLHADDSRSRDGDARLRAHRRDSLRRLRRLRGQGACDAHRRRQAETRAHRVLRHRARPHREVQAAARPGDRALRIEAEGRHPAAARRRKPRA